MAPFTIALLVLPNLSILQHRQIELSHTFHLLCPLPYARHSTFRPAFLRIFFLVLFTYPTPQTHQSQRERHVQLNHLEDTAAAQVSDSARAPPDRLSRVVTDRAVADGQRVHPKRVSQAAAQYSRLSLERNSL
jgi:hypothetical protein